MARKAIIFGILTTMFLLMSAFLAPISKVEAGGNRLNQSTPTSFDEIDAYIEKQLKVLNVPGASLAIIEGDRIVHTKGFGVSGPEGLAPTLQTPYFIGSLTKSFTALAVMQLVEEGKIDLDAPVQQYLPWFTLADQVAASKITVRHLLIQTSGIGQVPGMVGLADFDTSADATERQIRDLADYAPSNNAGAVWEYSNVNFNLLGLIVESASGESYEDYVQEHIFIPLCMKHSYTSKEAALANGLITGHQQWFGFPIAVPNQRIPVASLPSGQLISSAEDMGAYLIAQLNQGNAILSREGLELMHQPTARVDMADKDMGYYGMGWFVNEIKGQKIVFHYGEVPDYFAYMAMLPDHNRAIVLLINTNEQFYTFALWMLGETAALSLAGVPLEPFGWSILPWTLRSALLLPVLQIVLIVISMWRLKGKRLGLFKRPVNPRVWIFHLVLPTVFNLILILIPVAILASGLFDFLMLFIGDLLSVFVFSGIIALIWIIVRTSLILGVFLKSGQQMENI